MLAPRVPRNSLLPTDWRRDPVAAGTLLAAATAQLETLERKEAPLFWPGVPPQPGPGMYQRFLPGSPATWVPGDVTATSAANSAIVACLLALSTAFPEPPLRVYRRQTEGEPEALPAHAMQPLIDRPNPHHTDYELWFWTQFAKNSHGNAYWRKVRAGDTATGNVVELWPLSPLRVEPVTTAAHRRAGGFISYYRYETDPGRHEDIDPQDIVHFRLGLDDRDHRVGCAPLRYLLREVATDDEITGFMQTLLGNYAVPGLVVTTPDRSLSEEQAEQLKNSVSERFSGSNRGKVGVLNNGATVAQFGFSPTELDLKALHRVPEERITAVLRVPPIIAGLGAGLDRSIYNNAREAREAFTEQTLTGLWRSDAARITLELLPDFDRNPRTFCKFDLTDVRALQEDEDKKYARLNLGVQGQRPWIKRNEARAEIGLAPVPGWDEEDEQRSVVPPALQGAQGGGGLAAQGEEEPGSQALPDERRGQRRLPPPRAAGARSGEAAALTGLEQNAIGLQLFPALMDAMVNLAMPGFRRDLEAFFAEQRERVAQAVIREAA